MTDMQLQDILGKPNSADLDIDASPLGVWGSVGRCGVAVGHWGKSRVLSKCKSADLDIAASPWGELWGCSWSLGEEQGIEQVQVRGPGHCRLAVGGGVGLQSGATGREQGIQQGQHGRIGHRCLSPMCRRGRCGAAFSGGEEAGF